MKPQTTHNNLREEQDRQQKHGPTHTSEEEEETQNNINNEWQVIRHSTRKRNQLTQNNTPENKIETHNRYGILTNETSLNSTEGSPNPTRNHKPPPIFIHGVINYGAMINQIRNIVEDEQYSTKSLSNNVIKINCVTPETYRTFIRYLKENDIYYHTYQLKEERAYRIVIKHLHHSTDIEEIRQELLELGHKARNILNAHHRITKEPLNLFFIDLEPAENNKEIYKITALQNKIIQIEPPRAKKNNIVQCMRCQQYGHTKSYCNRPFSCVKCGGHHNSKECTKHKDTPATCALCGDNHPANYRGCENYHNILKESNTHRKVTQRTHLTHTNTNDNTIQPCDNLQQSRSYAELNRSNTYQFEDTAITLTKFINEFKELFNQLLQQNSMILNMITKLINKKD
jgi:hypothetical protein